MDKNLYQLAKEYIDLIEELEKSRDPLTVQGLEEKRIALHGQFMDKLKSQGIPFKDRDHATRIAFRIANGEL